MNEEFNLIINGRDRASAAIRGVSSSVAGIGTAGQRAGDAIRRSMGAAQVAVGHLGQAFQRATGIVAQFAQAAGVAGGVGGGVGLAGLAGVMGMVAKAGVSFNMTLQGARTALTQLLGSAGAANAFLGQLQQEAARSIPTLSDLVPLAVQLVQAYGPQGLGKVLPTIRAFGDAAAIAAGGDTNRMSLALLGFRQMLSRGFAQQEELNQIGENLGVSVTNILKTAFGTADTEALKAAGFTGAQIADAIVAGLQRQFGGAQMRQAGFLGGLWSNIQDAVQSISGRVTQGLGGGLQQAASTLLQLLNRFQQSASGAQIMAVIARGFTAVGDAIAYAASKFPALVSQLGPLGAGLAQSVAQWIRFTADLAGNQSLIRAFVGGLSNIGALLQTIVQTIFRIDFGKVFDPKNILKFFDAMWEGTKAFLHGVFGMGRAFSEFGLIVRSTLQDVGDMIYDLARGMEFGFRQAFINIQKGAVDTVAGVIEAFADIAKYAPPFLRGQFGDETTLRGFAFGMRLRQPMEQGSLNRDRAMHQGDQIRRTLGRLQEDPRRGLPFGERMAGAFNTPDAFERDFFKRLEQNAAALYQRFYGGFPGVNVAPVESRPMLYGNRPAGGASVTTVPSGPAIPAYPGGMPAGPANFTADQLYQMGRVGAAPTGGGIHIYIQPGAPGEMIGQVVNVLRRELRESEYGVGF